MVVIVSNDVVLGDRGVCSLQSPRTTPELLRVFEASPSRMILCHQEVSSLFRAKICFVARSLQGDSRENQILFPDFSENEIRVAHDGSPADIRRVGAGLLFLQHGSSRNRHDR